MKLFLLDTVQLGLKKSENISVQKKYKLFTACIIQNCNHELIICQ